MFCFRAVALFLFFGITLGSYAPYYDLANAEQHFADFINKYEKKYESVEEFGRRFEIFKRTLNKLNQWNEQYKHENGGYVITQFSDQEGPRPCVDISKMSNTTRMHQVRKESILNAPDKVDYRDQNLVTEVKNQANCGSCYIFAAIGNIEGMHAKNSGEQVSLSEQQALDCTNHDCNGGAPVDVMKDMASQGCMAEQDYLYTAVKGTCSADPNKVKVKVTGGQTMNTPDVETMKGALVENGAPLAVVFHATRQFESFVGSGVVNPTDCDDPEPLKTYHAILLVGYNADPDSGKRPHWIIKNSWGTDHGDQGYYYLDFENHCEFGTGGAATATVA